MQTIEGAIVTIAAMGCQRGIARTLRDKKANYILALKGNQPTLKADIEEVFRPFFPSAPWTLPPDLARAETVEKCNGRIETRRIETMASLNDLLAPEWEGIG